MARLLHHHRVREGARLGNDDSSGYTQRKLLFSFLSDSKSSILSPPLNFGTTISDGSTTDPSDKVVETVTFLHGVATTGDSVVGENKRMFSFDSSQRQRRRKRWARSFSVSVSS